MQTVEHLDLRAVVRAQLHPLEVDVVLLDEWHHHLPAHRNQRVGGNQRPRIAVQRQLRIDERARVEPLRRSRQIDLAQHRPRARVESLRDARDGRLEQRLVGRDPQRHLVADAHPRRVVLGQIERDAQTREIGDLDQRLRARSAAGGCGKQRAGIGESSGDRAVERRAQNLVTFLRARPRDRGLGDLHRFFGLLAVLLRDAAGRRQALGARSLLPAQHQLRLGGAHLLVDVGRFQLGDFLPGLDLVAFVDQHLLHVAGDLRVERGALLGPDFGGQRDQAVRRGHSHLRDANDRALCEILFERVFLPRQRVVLAVEEQERAGAGQHDRDRADDEDGGTAAVSHAMPRTIRRGSRPRTSRRGRGRAEAPCAAGYRRWEPRRG